MSSLPCRPAVLTIPPGISPAALLDSPTPIETNVQRTWNNIEITNKQIPQQEEFTKKENQFGVFSSSTSPSSSDDGFTWRKYGQKRVKGSNFPRSYYKCTQQSCPVRKKLECAPNGQVIEIVYNGAHNHPKTQSIRRPSMDNSYVVREVEEIGQENASVWRNQQFECNKNVSSYRANGLKRTSSASVLTEVSDPMSTNPKSMRMFESAESPELSSTLTSYDGDDGDWATQEGTFLGDDVNEYELEPKRRSYYKCTNAGCIVRKHVERASDKLKSVITTYEGKHNHEVPSTNKTNGVPGHIRSASTLNGQPNCMSSRKGPKGSNCRVQVQDLPFPFERKPFVGSEYLRPSFVGSYLGDLSFGACSVQLPKFPLTLPLPSRMSFPARLNEPPLGDFHLNNHHLPSNGASNSFLAVGNMQHINDENNNSSLLKAKEEIQWT